MENFNEIVKRLTLALITLFFSQLIMADTHQPLFFPHNLSLQTGDLIFREGTEPVSSIVLKLDNTGYSHVGMLYKEKDTWYVIHATPSEKKGVKDSVVMDNLAFYLSKQNAKKYAIYQVQATARQHKLAIKYALKQLGTPFDITGKEGTYCTLLILDAWKEAGINLQVTYSKINLPLVGGYYLLPKDLRASPKLKETYKNKLN